jgi:hypothetical protein
MMHSSSRAEKVLPGSDRRTWVFLGSLSSRLCCPFNPISKQLPAKPDRQGIRWLDEKRAKKTLELPTFETHRNSDKWMQRENHRK